MSNNDLGRHSVCTYEEALRLIQDRTTFYVSNCGCRERKGECKRSRMDLCLQFGKDVVVSGSNKREISKEDALDILNVGITKKLIARPFTDSTVADGIGGICFCCDDCCGVTLNHHAHCAKGSMIESTVMDECIHCGKCVKYSYFDCRELIDRQLIIHRDKCYGCGICAEVCPTKCIQMIVK